MDPLGGTASVVAILGALISVTNAAHTVISGLREAPKELQALSQESLELKAVLVDVTAASQLQLHSSPITAPDPVESPAQSALEPSALSDHLTHAESILTSLQDLLDMLTISSDPKDYAVKRIGWLKNRKKFQKLRKDLKSLKLNLAMLLLSKTLYVIMGHIEWTIIYSFH